MKCGSTTHDASFFTIGCALHPRAFPRSRRTRLVGVQKEDLTGSKVSCSMHCHQDDCAQGIPRTNCKPQDPNTQNWHVLFSSTHGKFDSLYKSEFQQNLPACSGETWGSEHVRPGRKVDVWLPGKGNSNSHSARPVHLIITMIKWIRTSEVFIKNLLVFQELRVVVPEERR